MAGLLRSSLLGAFLVAVSLTNVTAARADEVKVMAANAVKEPFVELVSAFEKSTGHKVTAVWSVTAGVTKRISDGEVVDVVIVGAATSTS